MRAPRTSPRAARAEERAAGGCGGKRAQAGSRRRRRQPRRLGPSLSLPAACPSRLRIFLVRNPAGRGAAPAAMATVTRLPRILRRHTRRAGARPACDRAASSVIRAGHSALALCLLTSTRSLSRVPPSRATRELWGERARHGPRRCSTARQENAPTLIARAWHPLICRAAR